MALLPFSEIKELFRSLFFPTTILGVFKLYLQEENIFVKSLNYPKIIPNLNAFTI